MILISRCTELSKNIIVSYFNKKNPNFLIELKKYIDYEHNEIENKNNVNNLKTVLDNMEQNEICYINKGEIKAIFNYKIINKLIYIIYPTSYILEEINSELDENNLKTL